MSFPGTWGYAGVQEQPKVLLAVGWSELGPCGSRSRVSHRGCCTRSRAQVLAVVFYNLE